MITDVFAADPASLPAHRAAGFPEPQGFGYPTLRGRGLDPVTLAVLDLLLSGVPVDEAIADAVRTPGQDHPDLYTGPVVTVLSSRTVRMLPAVAGDKLDVLAADWIGNGELAGVSERAVSVWLADAQRLFRESAAAGRLLFVWNCL